MLTAILRIAGVKRAGVSVVAANRSVRASRGGIAGIRRAGVIVVAVRWGVLAGTGHAGIIGAGVPVIAIRRALALEGRRERRNHRQIGTGQRDIMALNREDVHACDEETG